VVSRAVWCINGGTVRSIVLANQKGGVGKTTTAIHLAHGLAIAGERVVLFDLDPQGNATVAVHAMAEHAAVDPELAALLRLDSNLWLLPSSGAAVANRQATIDVVRLQELVQELQPLVDWLVIDCPPRMDEWGWAGVQIADDVLVPVQAEFFAMHGLSQMLDSLAAASTQFPGKARLRGVLPTMVNYREAVSLEIMADLRANLGDKLLQTVIVRDPSLVEAASFGRSVFQHSPASKSAFCYAELVKEIQDG
jgi:chromosome partitioning protein